MEVKVLLEEPSPYQNIVAVVEDFGEAVYFSLFGPENIIPLGETPDTWRPMRSCWVCNTKPVQDTDVFDMSEIISRMEQGIAPAMG